MNNTSRLFLIFLIPYIISVLITIYLDISHIKLFQTDFIIQYLGIFLGFTIALLSFAVSISDKLKDICSLRV